MGRTWDRSHIFWKKQKISAEKTTWFEKVSRFGAKKLPKVKELMTHSSASAPMLGTPYYKKLKTTEQLIPTSHYVICEGRGPESFSLSSFRLCLCSLSLCVWSMIGFLLYLIIDPLLSLFFSPYFLSLVILCQWNMIRLYLSKILAFSANKCMCYPHIRCSS